MTPGDAALERLMSRGEIPVFPLPNVVFFPLVSLGLHIFEPRYRRMVEEALAGDRLIAVALLKTGWETEYEGNPPVHEVACAGVIEEHQRLPDGRFNIRLRGVGRIALGRFVRNTPYRVATFHLLRDRNGDGAAAEPHRERLLNACAGLWRELAGSGARAIDLPPDLPFALGVNALCQSLAGEDQKQRLLETDDVVERCQALVAILTDLWKEASLRQDGAGPVH